MIVITGGSAAAAVWEALADPVRFFEVLAVAPPRIVYQGRITHEAPR